MDASFFIENRREFSTAIGNGIVILHSGITKRVSTHETYTFRPNKNFFYLTGLIEVSLVAVFIIDNNDLTPILFIPEIDEEKQKWDGKQLTRQDAAQISGIRKSSVYDLSQLNIIWEKLQRKYQKLPLWINQADEQYDELKDYFKIPFEQRQVHCFHSMISKMRGIKKREEINALKKVSQLAIKGIESVIRNAKPGIYEYELEAFHDYEMKSAGIRSEQFKTILASGKNTTILHYLNNDALIEVDDLILIDIDVEFEAYHSDITRTFPANGRFSSRQRLVYEEVLDAQITLIQSVKPGVTYGELNQLSKELLSESCKRLGLINDSRELNNYYFHNIGHAIGLDTHDVFEFTESTVLEPGMVLTIEPGLYIPEENIGVRIEDIIFVTNNGSENITKRLVKDVKDIEFLMQ